MRLVCEGCGAEVEPSAANPFPASCPRADADGADHLLARPAPVSPHLAGDLRRPFLDFAPHLAAWQLGVEEGLTAERLHALFSTLDRAVADVDGRGFELTPLRRLPGLERELGVAEVWAKDETGNVSGSHKARHLMGLALYLAVLRELGWMQGEPRLAIASCGNAGLAAGVIAAAAKLPLEVFLPPDADAVVVERLRALGAGITVCERAPGQTGDPTLIGFQGAVAEGALPFCCQGNEAGLTLDGGLTLGWELNHQLSAKHIVTTDVFVQVGGGALGSSLVRSLSPLPRVHTVQTRGAAPLERATRAVSELAAEVGLDAALARAAANRGTYMWPWESPPHSVAHGILDDETYDWHALVAATLRTDGHAHVVSEDDLHAAHQLVHAEGLRASHTGTAGVAGLIAARRAGMVGPDARALVLITGVER